LNRGSVAWQIRESTVSGVSAKHRLSWNVLSRTATHNSGDKSLKKGHEIGNHSMRHPCNDNNLPERRNLRLMTWQQVADEVNDGEGWIVKYIFNGELKDHTYAYPCGDYSIGPASSPNDPSPEMARRVGQCEYAAILSWNVQMARTLADLAVNWRPAGFRCPPRTIHHGGAVLFLGSRETGGFSTARPFVDLR
jgi:hypothetical protein